MSIMSDLGKIIVRGDPNGECHNVEFQADWYDGKWGLRGAGTDTIKSILMHIGLGRGAHLPGDGVIMGERKVAMKYEINLCGDIVDIIQLYILNEGELVKEVVIDSVKKSLESERAQQVDSAEASTIAIPPSEPSGSPR